MPNPCLRSLVALVALAAALAARAGEVKVAVAANFAVPLERLGAAFTAATGHTIRASAGATGKFHAQVLAGAPFEVLLAADDATPGRLLAEGHAVAGSRFTYAVGRLVLWSAQPGFVDDRGAVLGSPRVTRIAIANPKVAPYGAAALDVLRARDLADRLAPRLVMGESIGQAFQFVATGNAEIGFVALSQVMAPGQPPKGSHWLVPPGLHREIRQDAVLLQAGARNPAAWALVEYLKSAPARELIRSFGYGP